MDLSGYPKTLKLKDGTQVTVRPMVAGDLEALYTFFSKDVPEEDRQFLRDDVADRGVIEYWVNHLNYDKVLPLLLLANGRIIADGTIRRPTHGWSRHMAEVRLVVARDFQNQGVGLLLLKELVALARKMGVEMIQAQALEDSPTGLTVFERLGFRIEAVLHNFANDIKGNRQNLVILVRDVTELWKRMEDLLWETDWRGDS